MKEAGIRSSSAREADEEGAALHRSVSQHELSTPVATIRSWSSQFTEVAQPRVTALEVSLTCTKQLPSHSSTMPALLSFGATQAGSFSPEFPWTYVGLLYDGV